MTILAELQALIGPDMPYHCYSMGDCTAHKSPGFFASVKTRSGEVPFAAEGATLEEAVGNLLAKMRGPAPTPVWQAPPAMVTRPQMPGMTRRMPGM